MRYGEKYCRRIKNRNSVDDFNFRQAQLTAFYVRSIELAVLLLRP